jgi:hypothetical protein
MHNEMSRLLSSPVKHPWCSCKQGSVILTTENLEDGAYFEPLPSASEIGNRIQFDIVVDGSPVEIEGNDVLCRMLLAHVSDSGQRGGWSVGLIFKKTHLGLYFRVGTIDNLTYAPFFQDAEMKVTVI